MGALLVASVAGLLLACGVDDAPAEPSPPPTALPGSVLILGPAQAAVGDTVRWSSNLPAELGGLRIEWRFGDGGASWTPQPLGGAEDLVSVQAAAGGRPRILGASGGIYATETLGD